MTDTTRITDPARDRYQAIAISSEWEIDRLRGARALVVGAGALGNEVAKNLAMMGVRLIVIVDRDTVEVANLTRSVFFREADHGRPKAEVLAERLRELNPDVETLALNGDIEQTVGLGLVRRMDMVFSCLDNRLARRTVNRMCQKVAKTWVDGAMENLIGDVAVYMPDDGPCYECTMTRADKEIIAQAVSCQGIALSNIAMGKVPTTSTMGSIVAAIQVQEAVKILHGDAKKSLAGKRLAINCGINDFYVTQATRKHDCEGHFRYGDIIEDSAWTTANTTPREILARRTAETGQKGHLRLGREIVIGLQCAKCATNEELGEPLRLISTDRARCPTCGEGRKAKTTNVVCGTELFADWPLTRLGVPMLDILEVRTATTRMWYETTGDLRMLPAVICSPE